jgi:sodium transport system ATP-binding protein
MKVAIARALVHDPDANQLDEPTNGLDIMSNPALRDLLRRLRDPGKCRLFSAHVMQEVTRCATDRGSRPRPRGRHRHGGELLAQTGETAMAEAFGRLLGTPAGRAA